jgi:small-conductance mechanosensitive channel
MLDSIREFMAREFLGNSLGAWAWSVALAAATFAVLAAGRRLLLAKARAMSARKARGLAELLPSLALRTNILVVLAVAVVVGTLVLSLPDKGREAMRVFIVLVVALQMAMWGVALVNFGLAEFVRRKQSGNEATDASLATSMTVVRYLVLLVFYAAITILALENMGVDVTAMVAGLGIGGIAVALASQRFLGDLFGSLAIVMDKPFIVGDFIIVGDKMGTVENIGLKTTRVRALSGEQLVFTNSDLLESRVQNFKRMQERRAIFMLGVEYQTPAEKLERIPTLIREAIERQGRTRFDRAHFKAFGPSSLDFEAVYYMLVPDYNAYMDVQQAVNLEIFRRFQEEGVNFAYPTQTLHIASMQGIGADGAAAGLRLTSRGDA